MPWQWKHGWWDVGTERIFKVMLVVLRKRFSKTLRPGESAAVLRAITQRAETSITVISHTRRLPRTRAPGKTRRLKIAANTYVLGVEIRRARAAGRTVLHNYCSPESPMGMLTPQDVSNCEQRGDSQVGNLVLSGFCAVPHMVRRTQ